MKDNNFNFNQVFLNTIDSKQLLSFLHLNNISANISERSLSILLAKASFAFLLISMFSYWFQMSFNAQKLMNSPLGVRRKSFASHSNRALQISQIENLSHLQRADQKNKAITYNLYYFLEKVPFISMWSANITLALLLSIRWIESGHFPLSNLYESLLFLSWSLTVIHLFLENLFNFNKREQTLTLGAITSPVALFTNAFATFSLPQEMQKVTVLVPALKSNWLIMHVSVMIISYAALLSGSLLAMAFLVIKFIDDNSYKSSICTSTNLRLVRFARGSSASYSSGFNKSISSTSNSLNDSSNDSSSDSSNGSSMNSEEIILYPDRVNASARVVPYPIKSFLLYPEKGKGSWEFLGYSNQESEVEGSKPLLLKNLIKENKVLMDLPQILDNLSYRSIGLGFALLTIGILSGAVWANEAWGSYWSWDPKETWALITWLVFALYLHTRLSKGWVGKESAFVASFGFIVIWFCYLGVNLFGKGLHSYGWFQQ